MAKLTVNRIKHIVDTERELNARYYMRAQVWERMYFSLQWDRNKRDAIEQDGKELVTLPTAWNTVHLGMRLISNQPKIEVPSCHATNLSDENAQKRKKWLLAMYQRVNAQQGMDVIEALKWQSMVRGRHAVEVKWILESIPEKVRKQKFPIMVRPLDPYNVGVIRGPYWTEFAYVLEENVPRWRVRQQYPGCNFRKLRWNERRSVDAGKKDEDDIECDVIDAWWMDNETGAVWNAVLVDDEFAKEPTETDYPEIPIIVGYGDTTQAADLSMRGLSILYPIEGIYEYTNRLLSQIATSMLWYFWPHIAVTNDISEANLPDKITVRPGETVPYPAGTRIEMIRMEPNVPLATTIMDTLQQVQQQSTFPGVMYGEAGSMQAGYGVNLLTQSAAGRTHGFRRNLELTMESVNRIALALVEAFADEEGVNAWGEDEGDGVYDVNIKADQIEKFYENSVILGSETFQDDIQKIATGIQMVQAKLISAETFRTHIMPASIKLPSDERKRIEVETALDSDELRQKVLATTLIAYYPDLWPSMVKGTALEEVAMQVDADIRGVPYTPAGAAGGGAVPPDMAGMPPQGPPPAGGMPPEGMPPQGGPEIPPELQGAPPEAIDAYMQGMPLEEVLAILQQQQGPPPGPPTGPMSPQMQGGPQGMPMQPEAIPMAQGGGIPPELQGQLTPEMIGLPPNFPPDQWAAMMNDPMTQQEILRMLAERGLM